MLHFLSSISQFYRFSMRELRVFFIQKDFWYGVLILYFTDLNKRSAMAQWVKCQTANQVARVRIPANTNVLFLSVFLAPDGFGTHLTLWVQKERAWCGDQKTWEHVSGSIPESEISPVKQDTDLAPDIGRASHDYSCSSNADFRWRATSSGLENRTGTGWQWLIRR